MSIPTLQTSFDRCVAFTLGPAIEGGYVNNPNDPGGETNFGISKRSYPDLDIKNLTRAQAIEIYRRDFWEPSHCYSLRPYIALYVFDMAVNHGPKRAVMILQEAANTSADGEFGLKTLDAVQEQLPRLLINQIHARREAYYRSLADFTEFGHGWLHRNDACRDTALSWVNN